MRAMLLESAKPAEKSPLVPRDLPAPEPGAGEVRVRVSCCGLCHTDLHTVEGDLPLPKLPLVPGHQVVGVVEAVGAGARRFREGDRVGIPWLHWTCGQCDYCRRGQENLCDRARFTGYHVDGGYAESAVVGEEFACSVPSAFDDAHAAPLLCAGIVGYRSLRLSGARPGQRLGLYGFGASAHIVLQCARHVGCEVWVFTRSREHQELATKLGAAWVGAAGEEGSGKAGQLDSAIIFAPAGGLVPQALAALRKGGTLALAGITMSPIPQLDYASLYQERVVRSVANATREDARQFLELAAAVPVRTEVQMFDLEQANAALAAMKASKVAAAGVLRVG
ncbi:MAG TPA: zinc-dependent alcohol dehydrogenase family protein [Terriglobales bacterium]|jgi:propanol-preferring alcohol dehydrogenase|nr:zinc-dependent alcohol dehydrogenase family protein [Terriglobales bacterium]